MMGVVMKFREADKIIKQNGYVLDRTKGDHFIYKNSGGRIIVINQKPNKMIWKRLVKENSLIVD